MQYLGGKSRVAPTLAAAILARRGARTRYVEPFLGAGSIAARLARHFADVRLSDAHPDLVMMWNAVLNTDWYPPTRITKQEWEQLRDAPPSPERGFAGFAYSYGGRWFHHYQSERSLFSARSLLRKAQMIGPRQVRCHDYRDADGLIDANTVVYADPPYAATTQDWDELRAFDSEAFWAVMDAWSARGALVVVSGYDAPSGWGYAWRARPLSTLGPKNEKRVGEYLFVRSAGYRRVSA